MAQVGLKSPAEWTPNLSSHLPIQQGMGKAHVEHELKAAIALAARWYGTGKALEVRGGADAGGASDQMVCMLQTAIQKSNLM